jgi:hypothetical protein
LLLHLPRFACTFGKNEAPHDDAPYRSISVPAILLDSRFCKE